MVIRLYTSSSDYVPGPYKNSVLTKVSRETATKGSELEAGTGMEAWRMEDGSGGVLSFARHINVNSRRAQKLRLDLIQP
jgi:hypothetical protein